MEHFVSGKRNYYGKGDVIAYRLSRDAGSSGRAPVFAANVLMLIYGDVFWPTYTTGINTGLIATDSMKNFILRETLGFADNGLEDYCRFLGSKFLAKYPQVEDVQVSAVEIPYAGMASGTAFVPSGPERATARVELGHAGLIEVVSGIRGFKLLRLSGSSFHGFVRDEYTTLPDQMDRALHIWLDLEWSYTESAAAFSDGVFTARTRKIVHEVYQSFESGSIQQVIHQMGTRMLAEIPAIAEVRLEASNRTWDTVAKQGQELGVYTEPAPPYGFLGLRLKR